MTWLVVVLILAGAVAVVYGPLRNVHRLQRITASYRKNDHGRILELPPPRGQLRHVADLLRSHSAVLCGRYGEAVTIMAGIEETTDVERVRASASPPDMFTLAALTGLGRYNEVAIRLGDKPDDPLLTHIRAQVAIEVGDDELALRLLGDSMEDGLHEAGRLRILGDLHLRRDRLDEGMELVTLAMDAYASSPDIGVEVDRAYCHIHLAEAALGTGLDDDARYHTEAAATLMTPHPGHAEVHSYLGAIAAELAARRGDRMSAERHLHNADDLAQVCRSADDGPRRGGSSGRRPQSGR